MKYRKIKKTWKRCMWYQGKMLMSDIGAKEGVKYALRFQRDLIRFVEMSQTRPQGSYKKIYGNCGGISDSHRKRSVFGLGMDKELAQIFR